MGKLHQTGNLIIGVYANDHLPPHFHIVTPDAEALIEIAILRVPRGGLPATAHAKAFEWITEHRDAIAAEWNRINPRFPVA